MMLLSYYYFINYETSIHSIFAMKFLQEFLKVQIFVKWKSASNRLKGKVFAKHVNLHVLGSL